MSNRAGGGSRWVGEGRMASSEGEDTARILGERSRKYAAAPPATAGGSVKPTLILHPPRVSAR